MESLIRQQREAGQFDSEGSFLLNPVAALRKQLASGLPEPHFYLFQVLQGLVASGAAEIEVALGRQLVSFSFVDHAQVLGDLSALRSRLFQGVTLASGQATDPLLTGMAAAVGQDMDVAKLYVAGSSSCLSMTLDDVVIEEGIHPAPYAILELHRVHGQGQSYAWTRVWGAMGEEGEIQRRFECCAPPLKVAGLETSPDALWRAEVPLWGRLGRIVLAEAALVGEGSQHRALPFTGPETPASTAIRTLLRATFNADGQREDEALVTQEQAFKRQMTCLMVPSADPFTVIWWIRHGMKLERTLVDLGCPGLVALAPADGLDVDLSGYGLVKNEAFQAKCRQVGQLARKAFSTWKRSEIDHALAQLTFPSPSEGTEFESLTEVERDKLLAFCSWFT